MAFKVGPDQYAAFPLHDGGEQTVTRAQLEYQMAKYATQVFQPSLEVIRRKYIFVSEVEFVEFATGQGPLP